MDCENFGPNRFHYPFATDSSNDEDDDNVCLTPRVKHYVEEVRFGETKPSSSSFKAARKARCKAEKGDGERKVDVSVSPNPIKYRGIYSGGAKVLPGGDKGFFGPHSDSVMDFRYGG